MTAGPVQMILPDPTTLRPLVAILALAAAWALLWRHWPLVLVLVLAAAASGLATVF